MTRKPVKAKKEVKTKISLNMIVGPYIEPFLGAALTSISNLVDEYVIIDTAPGGNPNRDFLNKWAVTNTVPVKIINMERGEGKDFNFAEARELARVNSTHGWILRMDADEVIHEKDISTMREVVNECESSGEYNGIKIAFYHFMVYPWLYQYIEPRIAFFKKNLSHWELDRAVHEILRVQGKIKDTDILYYHYGYCRGQEEVFKRWQLYAEIDNMPNLYSGQDPNNIISDRIAVSLNFTGEHPAAVKDTLSEMFSDVNPFLVKEIPRFNMTDSYVGLVLLTYNDEENLPACLESLFSTIDYPTVLIALDLGSTDSSRALLESFQQECYKNTNIKDFSIVNRQGLEPLTVSLNFGFSYLMGRQECEYIGWIHPDMVFEKGWLQELVTTLQTNQEVGKACSFNTRDGEPWGPELLDGQEQAYIIRRGVLLKVGLFDEKFIGIGGWEDEDMNARIYQEGFKIVIAPKSKVYHKGMATRERRDTTAEQIYNAEVYRKKWGSNDRRY